MTARLTPDQVALCARFAEIEPELSPEWLSFRNGRDGRTEIFAGSTSPGELPILHVTEEIGWADRELAIRAPQICLALAAALRVRRETIEQQKRELQQLRGEPDPIAPKNSTARWCSMVCQSGEFKDWLFSLGVDTSDQKRVDNHVRLRLRLTSRAELDTNAEAARAWNDMWKEFKGTQFGRAYEERRRARKEAK